MKQALVNFTRASQLLGHFIFMFAAGMKGPLLVSLGVVAVLLGQRARRDHDRRHPPQSPSHRRQPLKSGAVLRRIGRTKGGLNSQLYAVCDGLGKPIILLLTEGQMSDHKGAVMLFPSLPKATVLLGDKGYDSDRFRAALESQGIDACIPPKANRKAQYHYNNSSTASATKSRPCSPASRTGDASPPVTTDAPTPSCPPSPSPQPLLLALINQA